MSALIQQPKIITPSKPKRVKFNEQTDVKIIVIEMKHKLNVEQIKKLRKDLDVGCCNLM
jgi:hypothetical protein